MAPITQSDLSNLQNIAIQETQLGFQNLADLRQFVDVRVAPRGSSTVRFPKLTVGAASVISDGSSITDNTLSQDAVNIVVDQWYGVQHTLTDLAQYATIEQGIVDLSSKAATELVAKMNADIISLFAGFSNSNGTTNVAISEAAIIEGVQNLMDQGVSGPYYLVVSPKVYSDIVTLYAANTNITSTQVRDLAYAGAGANGGLTPINLFGASVVVSNNYISDANGDVTAGLFATSAIGAGTTDEGLTAKIQRDESLRGYKIVWSLPIKFAEINDEAGFGILADNG